MSQDDPLHLSIVVPAYNEFDRIVPAIRDIRQFMSVQPYRSELIVVDDGSTDGTDRAAHEAFEDDTACSLLRFPHNKGKGAAVRAGLSKANGRYRLFSDADLSTPIDEANKFLSEIENGADIVSGSRRVPGARFGRRQPVFREFSGRVFSVMVRMLLFPDFLDTQCGFKLFTADAARRIFSKTTIDGFGFDIEALYIAVKKLHLTVIECPVFWTDSPRSKVALMRDSRQMAMDIWRIRKNDRFGLYD